MCVCVCLCMCVCVCVCVFISLVSNVMLFLRENESHLNMSEVKHFA